jgi:hypothetical protein
MRALSRGGSIGGRDVWDPTVPDHPFDSKHKVKVYRIILHEASEPMSPAHYWLCECNHIVLKFFRNWLRPTDSFNKMRKVGHIGKPLSARDLFRSPILSGLDLETLGGISRSTHG